MEKMENLFSYTISKNSPYMVVTLNGVLNRATSDKIESCLNDIQTSISSENMKYILLNFQGVTKLDNSAVPSLHRFKKAIKDSQCILKACCILSEIRKNLLNAGIFGLTEMSETVETGLKSFK